MKEVSTPNDTGFDTSKSDPVVEMGRNPSKRGFRHRLRHITSGTFVENGFRPKRTGFDPVSDLGNR